MMAVRVYFAMQGRLYFLATLLVHCVRLACFKMQKARSNANVVVPTRIRIQMGVRRAWIARPTRKRTEQALRPYWSASARKGGFAMATCAWSAKKAPSWHQTLRENGYVAPVLKVHFKTLRGNGNAFHAPSTRSAQRPGWSPPRSAKSVPTQYPFRPQMVPLASTT